MKNIAINNKSNIFSLDSLICIFISKLLIYYKDKFLYQESIIFYNADSSINVFDKFSKLI